MDAARHSEWPRFDYAAWRATGETLHLWSQIVGKVRLSLTPWLNHAWHVPLYVSARGLTTGLIPHGASPLDIEFDFHHQRLHLRGANGSARDVALRPKSVADFHAEVLAALDALGASATIHGAPNEIPGPVVPFAQDRAVRAYDPEQARRFWRVLLQADRVLSRFRTGFLGKASPVHFFWGSFDLAASRFSGRRAPPHPGGVPHLPDAVAREAYSHEVFSAGFWPGGPAHPEPVFYAYAYPEPPGFRKAATEPEAARWDADLGEFLLPYEAVRAAPDPDAALLAFLQSAYQAAADAGGWDRSALECAFGRPRVVRAS